MKAFANYHPLVLFAYFLAVLVVAMFVTNPVLQGLALLGGLLFCAMLLKGREFGKSVGFFAVMFLLVAVTNPLFSHNGVTVLFTVFQISVTAESLAYGVSMAATLVAVMLWCQCYSRVMTSDKFLYLFGRLVPKLSLVLSMALRFIPQFTRQMRKVSRAQKAMGLYSGEGYMDRIKGAMGVFLSMMSWSLEGTMETSSSMRARGYGSKERTHFSVFRFQTRDGVMLAVIAGLLGITLVGTALGYTEFAFYPVMSPVPAGGVAMAVYLAFGSLCMLPFILEGKEALVWKYCVSKI